MAKLSPEEILRRQAEGRAAAERAFVPLTEAAPFAWRLERREDMQLIDGRWVLAPVDGSHPDGWEVRAWEPAGATRSAAFKARLAELSLPLRTEAAERFRAGLGPPEILPAAVRARQEAEAHERAYYRALLGPGASERDVDAAIGEQHHREDN